MENSFLKVENTSKNPSFVPNHTASAFRLTRSPAEGLQNEVYLLPEKLDEKVAKLHVFFALREKLTVFTQGQAVSVNVKVAPWNHQARYSGNIRLKERGSRAQKRNISEVLSDHSLSS